MKLFRSRQEKQLERDLTVRKGLSELRGAIRKLEKHEGLFARKAVRASRLGAGDQLAFLRATLERTSVQKRLLERQLLSLETALQIKDQVQSHAQFCQSMAQLSRSVSVSFRETDLARTQEEFLRSMGEAKELEQRLEILLDQTESVLSDPDLEETSGPDDQWIDQLIHEAESQIDS